MFVPFGGGKPLLAAAFSCARARRATAPEREDARHRRMPGVFALEPDYR